MRRQWVIVWILMGCLSAHLTADPIFSFNARHHPVIAKQGMVASQEALATQIGVDILKAGGNAVDAAVAVGFALAVTLPRAGNLGGGGFMMVYWAESNEVMALDYREVAPLLAIETMFLDENGDPDPRKSRDSVLSSGVPGTVAGLLAAHRRWGVLGRKAVLKPAIQLAKSGFMITPDLAESLKWAQPKMAQYPETLRVFYKPDGTPYDIGERFRQPDLAKTLTQIQKNGEAGFYKGKFADQLVSYMKTSGGLISHEDLQAYQPIFRKPVSGTYRGYSIYAMPPPSSGGVHLIQMLGILESFPIRDWGHNTAKTVSVMAEAMKFAYADRAYYLGDPDFVEVPVSALISPAYLKEITQKIKPGYPIPSAQLSHQTVVPIESNETTHYSVVDKHGNMVSNTYTLNFSYGNKQVVPGTGVLLNNEMDDFSAKPGVENAYGLIGGSANAVAPKKRMLSSMTPTLVLKDGRPFLATGSPGGSRIITTVLQILVNLIDHDMTIAEATHAPRFHHQWLPDVIRIESGFPLDTQNNLRQNGYKIESKWAMGSTQSVQVGAYLLGASDPRKPGALTQGY